MRFIDTKRFQPVIYGNDIPHRFDLFHHNVLSVPKTEPLYVKYLKRNNIITDRGWWQKQRERCLVGYTVPNAIEKGGDALRDGIDAIWFEDHVFLPQLDFKINNKEVWISGRMYFYLNFWSIRRVDQKTKRKAVGAPRFTSLSWQNWTIRELSSAMLKDLLWAKRRQCGLSEETACDVAYDYLFIRDSQVAIVAGEEKYALNTFKMVKRGIERLINSQFYKWSSLDNNDLLKAKYYGSEIHCRTARDNDQALSGLSPTKVIYEESGIWKRGLVRATAEFVNQSLEAEGYKTGQNVFISTAGDMAESVADVEYMCYNPHEFNLMSFKNIHEKEISARSADIACFIPGWQFEIIDSEGNTLRKESEIKLMKDRASKSSKDRFRAITLKPFYLSELFSNVSGGYFGEEIIFHLNERKAHLYTHKMATESGYYNLDWKDPKDWSKGVIATEEEEGEFYIMEHPETDKDGLVYENLYKGGTDSYDKDEANESNSKGSIHVFKGFLNANHSYKKWVARLTQRPKIEDGGAYKFFENTIKLSIYYNLINLIEWSNIRIFDFYKRNQMEHYLKERPDMIIARYVQKSNTNNTYGIDPSTKPHWLAILKDHLSVKENIDKMDDIEQIDAFARFKYDPSGRKYNCDVTISSSLSIVCYEDETELQIVEQENSSDADTLGVMVYSEDANGNIINQVR